MSSADADKMRPKDISPQALGEMLVAKAVEQGLRYNADKPRMSLIDSYAMEELAKVLTFGAKKYAAHNWRKGLKISECLDSMQRHINAYNNPHMEDTDPETGLSHMAHVMCNAMFILWLQTHKRDFDDRFPKHLDKYPVIGPGLQNAAPSAEANGEVK